MFPFNHFHNVLFPRESLTFGVIGGVVHGHGFESLPFWGQWCSAWSCVRIFVFLGVTVGVVHGLGFESFDFFYVNGDHVVHGRGFEST
jgi:hypothetical protein